MSEVTNNVVTWFRYVSVGWIFMKPRGLRVLFATWMRCFILVRFVGRIHMMSPPYASRRHGLFS